ncbi:hypothetical protein GD416_35150 [Burkholderia sp. BE24]|uniref:hypothetical protein n=1 Tax=unclassified Burkholderia TaxID=2613784 RepID=UPI00117E1EE6|nr:MULTISPECIES: hypothetical protein [unclassified Burkholderia]MPV61498.1 hypothetical protein [Burkholderia sp. BE24]
MKGNDVEDNHHGHQLAAIVNYAVSKRTSVSVIGLRQRASDGGLAELNGMNTPDDASSGATQDVARIGLHTHF